MLFMDVVIKIGPFFSQNNSATRRALKNKLFFKSFGKFSHKKYVFESPCCKI